SRGTLVPESDGYTTPEFSPCSACPNSWKRVFASSQLISTGSPDLPFTKLALLETMTGRFNSRDCLRYSFIHAPDSLPGRAYGSKYQSPTCLPSASCTSQPLTSGWS